MTSNRSYRSAELATRKRRVSSSSILRYSASSFMTRRYSNSILTIRKVRKERCREGERGVAGEKRNDPSVTCDVVVALKAPSRPSCSSLLLDSYIRSIPPLIPGGCVTRAWHWKTVCRRVESAAGYEPRGSMVGSGARVTASNNVFSPFCVLAAGE